MKEKFSQLRKHPKTPAVLTALLVGGVSITTFHNIPKPPLFPNTNQFVIFADQSFTFDESTTISSGDIGTNGNLDIGKDTTVNGNLFADKISIAKGTTINGNATYNKIENKGEILGTKTKPVSLPIANLSTISNFTIGTQDKTFSRKINTLSAGNYKNITLQKNSTLTLSGGTYNLNILDLKEHSTLIFNAPTTLNIQFKLRGRDNISIVNGANVKPTDLKINYVGTQARQFKNDKREDDEDEILTCLDKDDDQSHKGQERNNYKNQKIGRPIVFGANSFLNFALIATNANVIIGKDGTMRGQILARKARMGKNFVTTKNETFEKESDVTKVVTDAEGNKFIGNEIIVLFEDSANFEDAEAVAKLVGGSVGGYVPNPPMYKILLPTSDYFGSNNAIANIMNSHNSLVIEVTPNFTSELI
jgi:hypothetical protein